MKNKSILYLSILISLSACVPSITDPLQAENALPSESPAKQTAVPTEETNINSFEFPTPIVGTVALNFSERPCSASWSNNGEYLPCPGKINAITNGYAEKFDQIMIEGKILINQ